MAASIIFVLASFFFLYTMVLYPVLLQWLARRQRRPVRKTPGLEPHVTVVIPVRNGRLWIARKLDSVLGLDYPEGLMDVVVVSDGSTDGTDEIVGQYAGPVRLVRIEAAGKPAALNAGRAEATGEVILYTDVRQVIAPNSLRKMMAAFGDPEVGVVSGDVVIRQSWQQAENHVALYRKIETQMRNAIGELDSMFGAQGAFYAIRRDLAISIPSTILLDDLYQPLSAFVKGYRLVMEMEAVATDEPVGIDAEFWRKVRTLAGNYQILRAYPELWCPGKRLWWHFLSYKVARLLLPFMILAIGLSSFWLPSPLNVIAIGMQALAYGAALIDCWIPEGGFVKKLTSAAWTFLVMMAAAFCAPFVLWMPTHKLWKPTVAKEGNP